MKKQKNNNMAICDRLTVDTAGLSELLSCGRATAIRVGDSAQARVQIGRRVLWNKARVMSFIDEQGKQQN